MPILTKFRFLVVLRLLLLGGIEVSLRFDQKFVASRVITNGYFSPFWEGTNILTKFHEDWMKTINILTKFHKDWMKTVTSTVYTSKLLTDAHTHARTHIRNPDITWSHKLTMSLGDR
ncbi:hypothetical protein DPMN_038762 [Dreissena polymorpha]|uniref:Uncharacterized protein n=1 Tax=Dreissena polymorpha TaxID=45954 RepID=A0A9D4MDR0_DREPO|nr:hypothetical protein DPMN_038762 [Dreissena polymorpha]